MSDTAKILAKERARVERFHRVTQFMVLWKGDELVRYQAALLTTALYLYHEGIKQFGPDEVPGAYKPECQGIAGTAVGMLHSGDAPLIVPFWGTIPERGIFHGRRTSLSASRNGAKVFLYELGPVHLVEAWLRKYGFPVPSPKTQKELVLA